MYNKLELKLPKAEYFRKNVIINTDNSKIFNNIRTRNPNYAVYIWCDKNISGSYNLDINHNFKYKPVYIGSGQAFGSTQFWRAFNHVDDLLEDVLLKDLDRYVCYVFAIGVSKYNSLALEADIIKTMITKYDFYLTRRGTKTINELDELQLINKRREWGNEELSKNLLLKYN